jgi:hypothetical protein
VCDLEAIGAPSILKLIRSAGALARMFNNDDFLRGIKKGEPGKILNNCEKFLFFPAVVAMTSNDGDKNAEQEMYAIVEFCLQREQSIRRRYAYQFIENKR